MTGRRDVLRALGLGLGATGGCLRLTGDGTETSDPDTATPTAAPPPGDPTETPGEPSDPSAEHEESTDETSGAAIDGPSSVDFPLVDARNRLAQPDATVTGPAPQRRWRSTLDFSVYSRRTDGPLVTANHVVVRGPGDAVAYSRDDGSVAWRLDETLVDEYRIPTRILHRDGSLLFVGDHRRTDEWRLVVVAAADGRLERQTSLPIRSQDAEGVEEAPSMFTVDPDAGRAYVATKTFPNSSEQFADLLSVGLDSLAVRRERRLSSSSLLLEDAAVDGDLLVLTSDEVESADNVVAFDPDTLERRWSGRFGLGETMPVLGSESLYLATEGEEAAHVQALSRADGRVEWRFEIRDKPRNGVTLGPDGLYVVSNETLYRLDPTTGTPEWSYSPDADPRLSGSSNAMPVVTDGTVLLGSSFAGDTGVVRAIEADSGSLRWRVALEEPEAFAPLAVGDSLYTVGLDRGAERSALYALR